MAAGWEQYVKMRLKIIEMGREGKIGGGREWMGRQTGGEGLKQEGRKEGRKEGRRVGRRMSELENETHTQGLKQEGREEGRRWKGGKWRVCEVGREREMLEW